MSAICQQLMPSTDGPTPDFKMAAVQTESIVLFRDWIPIETRFRRLAECFHCRPVQKLANCFKTTGNAVQQPLFCSLQQSVCDD